MKLKLLSVAVASICFSQISLAQTKTLDFYSGNGVNRYSILGKIGDLNLPIEKDTVLITEANSEAYVKLNDVLPYHLRFIEEDLNLYQIIELNKGKNILYKGNPIKLIGSQNDRIIIESNGNILFVPLDEVSIPKTFLNDAQKGLKASFSANVNSNDILYFSQPERQLSYNNSYESNISGDYINLTHYLNITNSSVKTFDNVYLNFFLSETNVQNRIVLPPMPVMAKSMAAPMLESSIQDTSFDEGVVQNLKTISINKPTTIYPNFNKIKYVEKKYPLEQYAKIELQNTYDIYLGDEINKDLSNLKDLNVKGTSLNNAYIDRIEKIKEIIKDSSNHVRNMMNIKVEKGDILPSGKIDIYETVKSQDKLIVSTNINHTENKDLEVFKGKNSDLKIIDVELVEINSSQAIRNWDKSKRKTFNIKSLEIENVSDKDYIINVLNKKVKIKAKQKLKIV